MADITSSKGSIIQGKGLQYVSKRTKQFRHKVGDKSEAWFNPIPEAVAGETLKVGDVVSYALVKQLNALYPTGDIPNEVVVKTDSSEGFNEKAVGFVLEPANPNQKVHIVAFGDFRITIDSNSDEFYRKLTRDDIGKSIYVADNTLGKGLVTFDKGNATLKKNNVIQLGVLADVVMSTASPPQTISALIHVQADGDDRGVTDFTEMSYTLGEVIDTTRLPHNEYKAFAVCVGKGDSAEKTVIHFKKKPVLEERTNGDALFDEFTYVYIEDSFGWNKYLYILKGTKEKPINFFDKSILSSKGILNLNTLANLNEDEDEQTLMDTSIKVRFFDFDTGSEAKTIYKRVIEDVIIAKHLEVTELLNNNNNVIPNLDNLQDDEIFKVVKKDEPKSPIPIIFSHKLEQELSYVQENKGFMELVRNKVYLADPRYDKLQPVIGFIKGIENNKVYNEGDNVVVTFTGLVKSCNTLDVGRKYYLGEKGNIVITPERHFKNIIPVGTAYTQAELRIDIGQSVDYYADGRSLGDLAFFEDAIPLAYYGYIKTGTTIDNDMAETGAYEELYEYFVRMGRTLNNVGTSVPNNFHRYEVPLIQMGGQTAFIRYIPSVDNYNFPKRTYFEVEGKIEKVGEVYKLKDPIDITGLIYTNPDFVKGDAWILNRKDIRIKAFVKVAESYVELHEGFIQDGDIIYGFNWQIVKNTDGTNSLWKLQMELKGSRGIYLKNFYSVPGVPPDDLNLYVRLERDEIWTRDMKVNYNITGSAANLPIVNSLTDDENQAPSSKAVKEHIDTQLGVIKTELENNVITQFTGLNGAIEGRVTALETITTTHSSQIGGFDNKIKTLTSKMMNVYISCPQFKIYPDGSSTSINISKSVLQVTSTDPLGVPFLEFSTTAKDYILSGVSRFFFKNEGTNSITFKGTAGSLVLLKGIYFERDDEDKRIKANNIIFEYIHFKKQLVLKGLDSAKNITFKNCTFDKSISITMDSTKDIEQTDFLIPQVINLQDCVFIDLVNFKNDFRYRITENVKWNNQKATLKTTGTSSALTGAFEEITDKYIQYVQG